MTAVVIPFPCTVPDRGVLMTPTDPSPSVMRGVLRRAGEALLLPALTAWHLARDPNTPQEAKAALFTALAYLILPADAVPDFLPGIGFADDLAALTAALGIAVRFVRREMLEKAQASARGVFT
jgi:uncharacterized membrane protein YkvA (DUF1232 family)